MFTSRPWIGFKIPALSMYVQKHCVTTFNKKKALVGILCNILFYINVGIVKHKLPRTEATSAMNTTTGACRRRDAVLQFFIRPLESAAALQPVCSAAAACRQPHGNYCTTAQLPRHAAHCSTHRDTVHIVNSFKLCLC